MVVEVLAVGNVDQDALPEPDLLQIGAVGAQCLLGIGAAVGILEELPRNPALRRLPQVVDTGHCLHGWRFPVLTHPFR